MNLIDTHAHLYDESLQNQIDDVLARARAVGVRSICCIGTDLDNSRRAIALAERYSEIRAVVGFQPNYCHGLTDRDWEEMLKLADRPQVVGIGETGLDRYWKDCPFDEQWKWFERHVDLSVEKSLPIVIHMRDCEADVVRFLEAYKTKWPLQGIMHSFTGDWSTATVALDAGLHLSFAGMLTYKSSHELREVARRVPNERLLVETESPYLSPEPLRGKRPNEPARVVHTASCLAEARGVTLEEIAEITTRNATALFRI